MDNVADDWTHLGALIKKRRKALGMTQEQLQHAAGLGRSTVQKLEWGTASPERKTLRLIEDTLKWEPGSVSIILAGGEPILVAELTPDETYRRAPMTDDDLVTVLHHVVYDLAGFTNPNMTLTQLRELEERALRVARSVGQNRPGMRSPDNVAHDPEP